MEKPEIRDQDKAALSKILVEYRKLQSIKLAIMGGTGVALICSIMWAVITVVTNYQIGWMAIGVGMVIGLAVRYFGRGVDISFRFVGSLLSVISCLLGNILSLIWFAVRETGDSFFLTLVNLDYALLFEAMKENFTGMDLLFYGIAIYESYRFSVVSISSELDAEQEVLDQYKTGKSNQIRQRLAIGSLCSVLIILILPYFLSSGVQSYRYDSGELLSKGRYKNGKLEGEWKYFYKNGNIMSIQHFHDNLNTGRNIWYYENGNIQKIADYSAGLVHGPFEMYYENGLLHQKGQYELDRMNGKWLINYHNGNLYQEIEYKDDLLENKYIQYYKNKEKCLECNYIKDVLTGNYQFWDSLGILIRKSEYKNGMEYLVYYRDLNGNITVRDGNGSYTEYYPNKKPSTSGYYKDSLRTGIWKSYYEDGKLMSRMKYHGEDVSLIEWFTQDGEQKVIDGNGVIEDYDNGKLLSRATYVNGKIEGESVVYDTSGSKIQIINYSEGKMHGQCVFFNPRDTTMSFQGCYENNERDGEWIWYHSNGNVSATVNFVDGKKDGVQKFYDFYGIHVKNEIYEQGEKIKTEIVN